ncbi:MAG: hypothetical protein H7Y37_00215 [Anaerolineae bacterium]|nr:hypothetical protein [Gloeobacterales cyanobacterium ES-bin-313]
MQGRSLREFHQACTRLIRADYLGDGRSHTQEGTLVEVYDILGIRRRRSLPGSGMVFEAAWSPRGATCIHRTRLGESVRLWVQQCQTNRPCAASACTDATQALRNHPESLLFVHSFVRTQPRRGRGTEAAAKDDIVLPLPYLFCKTLSWQVFQPLSTF